MHKRMRMNNTDKMKKLKKETSIGLLMARPKILPEVKNCPGSPIKYGAMI
jgi:hypothetical protein